MSVRLFGHYVSVPLLFLILAEAAIHIGAVYLAGALRFDTQVPSFSGASALFPRALLYTLVMLGVTTAFGLYGGLQGKKGSREYQARFLASFPTAAVAMVIIFYSMQETLMGRGVMAFSFVFSFIGTLLVRELFFRFVGREFMKRRVLVLGSGSRAAAVDALQRKLGPSSGFHLVGFVPCGDGQPRQENSKILDEGKSLRELVKEQRIDEIVVGVRDRRNGRLSMPELLECKLGGVRIVDLSTFFERETGIVQLTSLSMSWMVYSEGFYRSGFRNLLKRLLDVCVSGAMLVAALPMMIIAGFAVWLECGSPILYRQKRVGECGKVFEILKFRSMRVDAEKDGIARWARQNDDRITRVGRFLRLTRVDELPQLINVLRGDMSFVGPRPERPPFVHELSKGIPFYATRHSVKPGITGWAQVRYPYGMSMDDAVQKLQFDLYYVKNHSFFLDLVILLQTAQVVLFGKGAR